MVFRTQTVVLIHMFPFRLQANTQWISFVGACGISKTEDFRDGLVVNFAANVLLLATMFSGVWRKKNSTQLWYVLYIQVRFPVASPPSAPRQFI